MRNSLIASILKAGIQSRKGDGAMLSGRYFQEMDLDEESRSKRTWMAEMLRSLQTSRMVLKECEEMKSRELDLLIG